MTMLLMTTLMTKLALLLLGHVRVDEMSVTAAGNVKVVEMSVTVAGNVRVVEMSVTAAGNVRVVEMSVTAPTSRTKAAVGTAASELLLTGNNNVDGSTRFLYS